MSAQSGRAATGWGLVSTCRAAGATAEWASQRRWWRRGRGVGQRRQSASQGAVALYGGRDKQMPFYVACTSPLPGDSPRVTVAPEDLARTVWQLMEP